LIQFKVLSNGYFTYINHKGIKSYEYEEHEILDSHLSEYLTDGYKEDLLSYDLSRKL